MYSERESELIQDIVFFFVTRYPESVLSSSPFFLPQFGNAIHVLLLRVLSELFDKVSKERIDDVVSSVVTLTFGRSATLTLVLLNLLSHFYREANFLVMFLPLFIYSF